MSYKRLKLNSKSKCVYCTNKNIVRNIKNKTNKNIISANGITLISLVITIIIIIILSSVSITMSLGKNRLFERAKEAKKQIERANIIEQIQIEILDKQVENEGKKISEKEIEDILSKYGEIIKDQDGKIAYIKVKEKYEIEIKELLENNKITVGDEKDPEKPEIKTDSEGHKQGESGYLGGEYNDPYIPVGFKHIGEEGWNAGYTIKGVGEGIAPDEFVWVPCVLTEEEQKKAKENGVNIEIFKKTTTVDYNYNLTLLPDPSVPDEDDSVEKIEESVGKYGGFYIAKYESGIESKEDNYNLPEEQRKSTADKPLSQYGKGVWNYINRTDAITVSKLMIDYANTGVHSTLISGAAWDTTLQWIVNTSDNKNTGYDTNESIGWNYETSGGEIHLTGYHAVNNIYDMSGNVKELTTENNNSKWNPIVARSGCFGDSNVKACARSGTNDYPYETIGFRVIIYK